MLTSVQPKFLNAQTQQCQPEMQLDGRRVLVTGGAGFIGSHLTQLLHERGAAIHALDDFSTGRPDLVPAEVTTHEVDLVTDSLEETLTEIDPESIVHLAAIHYVPYCNENPEEAFNVNVIGTRRLLEAATGLENLQRLVFASSAAVYEPAEDPHHEDEGVGPTDIYGCSKLVGEDLTELLHHKTGVSTVAARLFNVYGRNETNAHLIPTILEQVENGGSYVELGNLSPARDFIHAEDVVRGLEALLTTDGIDNRAYNIGTGTEWTVREVAKNVGEALGRDLDIQQAQERVRESDRPHLRGSTERIQSEVGWEPEIEFVDGLGKLLDAEGIR